MVLVLQPLLRYGSNLKANGKSEYHIACSFWLQAIKKFTSVTPAKTEATIKGEDWIIYAFESKDRSGI